MLENTTFPFSAKILKAIKRNEEQAAKGQPMEGLSPELLELASKGNAGEQK
jgi:hypothetical protein